MVSTEQWRAATGRWVRGYLPRCGGARGNAQGLGLLASVLGAAVVAVLLAIGGVELNPGPPTNVDIIETINKNHRELMDRIDVLQARVASAEGTVQSLQTANERLARKVDYLENQSRRNNIIVTGIPEQRNESWADSERCILELAEQLGVRLELHDIERAHRTGRRRQGQPRMIVAKLASFRKREELLRAAREYLSRNCSVRVREDFSWAVRQTRKALIPFLQEAKASGRQASIRFDKLVVSGRSFTLGALSARPRAWEGSERRGPVNTARGQNPRRADTPAVQSGASSRPPQPASAAAPAAATSGGAASDPAASRRRRSRSRSRRRSRSRSRRSSRHSSSSGRFAADSLERRPVTRAMAAANNMQQQENRENKMANTPLTRATLPFLKRREGAANPYGFEYEIYLSGLWALRSRRQGLSFQLYSNVDAAHPVDDIVLRVLTPQPLFIFIQLMQSSSKTGTKLVTKQALTSPEGHFSLKKYFEFYADYESKHTNSGLLKKKDDKLLHDCSLDDVRMVIYTTRPVAHCKEATDGPHLHFQHEDLLRTGDISRPNTVFSFGYKDQEVWQLYDKDPRKDIYQQTFLPRLRVFSEQAHVNDVKVLIRQELDKVFGSPLPQSDSLLLKYLDVLKHWAVVDKRGTPLTESSGELESLLVKELAKQGRAAAGGGALRFKEDHCVALRKTLKGSQGSIAVRVRGVPAGHRAAKVVQVLDDAFADSWAYVGDQQLREMPRAALEAVCGGGGHVQLLLLDVEKEEEVEKAHALVAAVGCSVKVVAMSSRCAGPLGGDEEDWRMDHLTLEAQEALMDRTLLLQGRPVPLRDLEPSWRSMRGDVDGALLSALVRGGAEMGAALPAPGDAHLDLPRTLEHPATLDPAVLERLDLHRNHLILSGFPESYRKKLYNSLSSKDDRSVEPNSHTRKRTEEEHREKEQGVNDIAIEKNKWWTVLPGAGGSSDQEAAFLRVAARVEESGLNVHWLHCVGDGDGDGQAVVVWKATRGATQAVARFVQPASDACGDAPTCVHAAEAVRHAAAWRQRVGLLVGEPGMGKSRFLQRLAGEAAQRWTVLLQALDHRHLLRDFPQPPDLTQDHVVELLAAAAGVTASAAGVTASASSSAGRRSRRPAEYESTLRFLKAALYKSGDIAVFIDGVNEIFPSYKDNLVRFLEMLLASKVQLVWVSSRPEAELVLTKTLRCTTSVLRPFSKEEQKKHLCGHWSSVDPRKRPPAAFENLATEMVAALHGAAGRGQRSLLDVPLHAQMAAEAYAMQTAQALDTGDSLQLQTGISLYQLYRRFVETKRNVYETRFGLKDPNIANLPEFDNNFEEIHQNCAMFVLVSDGTFNKVDSSPFKNYLDNNRNKLIKEKTGIMWLGEDEMPHFLHFTFIEYFAASWLLENQEKASQTAKEMWLALLNRDVGVGLKHILEHMLADGRPLHRVVLEGSESALETALEAGG